MSFDSAAVALTFVPAAGEFVPGRLSNINEHYTYHHLRRDVYNMIRQANLPVAPRYNLPSAHVTIARFISHDCFLLGDAEDQGQIDHARVKALIDKIDEINRGWRRNMGLEPMVPFEKAGNGLLDKRVVY